MKNEQEMIELAQRLYVKAQNEWEWSGHHRAKLARYSIESAMVFFQVVKEMRWESEP